MNTISLFDKQALFFGANKRINIYAGGIQSGKTSGGALKMYTAMLRYKSPDDNFIIAADTYKTLSQATLPKFMKFMGRYGKLNRGTGEFKTNWGSTVYLRTATHPDSVEGVTDVRHIWLDEGGKCSRYFFENLSGRSAFRECPIDVTTTPYSLNWLATQVSEIQAGRDTDAHFVQCRSIDSPYFPKAEYERQKKKLDPKRFAMKYDGVFGQMEGLVYDKLNTCKTIPMPPGTRYFGGIDWGYSPDPFAFVIRAVTPDGQHYRVAEFYRNFLTIHDIVPLVKSYDALYHFELVACDPSQPAHIEDLNRAKIPAVAAKNDIRLGIDRHYELIKKGTFWIFEDMNPLGIDEYRSYHYPETKELGIDESRKESETVPVDKDNHGCDADRYLTITILEGLVEKRAPRVPQEITGRPQDLAKRIEWLKRGGTSRVMG